MARDLWTLLTDLLDCAVDELALTEAGVPERVLVVPGAQVADDNCCEKGGQLWVRVISTMPVNPMPVPDTRPGKCGQKRLGTIIGVGATRCVPSIDNQTRPPEPDELTEAARIMVCDQGALWRAICCALDQNDMDHVVQRWDPRGPSGGCVSGEWRVMVGARMVDCTTSPPESP